MYIDNDLFFSNAQADVRAVAIWPSTVVYPIGVVAGMAIGRTPYLIIRVGAAFTDGAGASLTEFQIVDDANVNLVTTPTVHWTSGPLAVAALGAGVLVYQGRVPDNIGQAFFGCRYIVTIAAVTGGTINAFVAWDKPQPAIL